MGFGKNNRGKNRGHKSENSSRDGRGGNFGGSGRRFTGGYGRSSLGSGYGRGPRSSAPSNAPVEAGKEYEVEIVDVSRRGEGIAKVQGFIIFVPGGKPSTNKVKIKIERVSSSFASASLVGGASADEEDTDGTSESLEEGGTNDSSASVATPASNAEEDNKVESENSSQDLVERV